MIRLLAALLAPLLAALLPAAAVAAPPATLADLAWMEGSWEGPGIEGAPATETYSAAVSGAMPGHFRQLNADGTVMFYELITFVEHAGSLVLRLKHFNADLTGWEEMAEVESFPLTATGPNRWTFGGITYERNAEHAMDVAVLIHNADGEPEALRFSFRRHP